MTDISSQQPDTDQHWTGTPAAQDHEPEPAPGLIPCPRCTNGVLDLGEHLRTCPESGAEEEPKTDPVTDARRVIAEDQQRRMQACLADIEAVLDKHGMSLDVQPARVLLVPKE